MRRRIALWLAAATGVAILLLAVLFASVQQRRHAAAETTVRSAPASAVTTPPANDEMAVGEPTVPSDDHRVARGKEVYREQKCAACHSIAGSGNPRSPLDGVGGRLPAETIRRWIVEPQSVKPSVRKPAYAHLAAADIDALVLYLTTLTDP